MYSVLASCSSFASSSRRATSPLARLVEGEKRCFDSCVKLWGLLGSCLINSSPALSLIHTYVHQIFLKFPMKTSMTDWTKQFFLNTDGSHIAIAGILMKKQDDGELHPISYYSRTLTATESRYPANKLELLAIHNSVKYFREFLYGRKFTILSDHMNFKYHTDLQNPANIIARWLMDLSEYEFEFQHVKGKNNLLTDYISREKHGHADIPPDKILPAIINSQTINALITQELSDEIILTAQDADDNIQKIKSSLQEEKHKNREKYFIDHNSGLLMHIGFHQNYLKEDICHKTIVIPHFYGKTLSSN
ncbi:retrovirus-related Pol polyprotein from transposon 297 [Trichonephila clavipes]|nr:retrovirus-related Pol polyprotein from transposon 297 [Trichonephila clavipes]